MSANPEVETIVPLPVQEASPAIEIPPAPALEAPIAGTPAPRKRAGWIAPAAVAVIGVIAAGTLGYFLYATVQQRDGLHARLVATQGQLSAAQADAAAKKVTATYVATYVADAGKVQTDYSTLVVCDTYSTCRTAAQQMLTDMQSFQSDRKAATVPSDLLSTDSSTGDALSAAIAGDQELIVGMDNNDVAKMKEGGSKVDNAMLSLAKAQASLGSLVK